MSLLFKRSVRIEVDCELFTHKFTDLNMSFSVDLSVNPEPNEAIVNIVNVSEFSRDDIWAKGQAIRIYAGYQDNPGLIFSGNLITAKSQRTQTGFETEITARDGHGNLKAARFDKTFSAGTPLQTILAAMCAPIGLPFELGFIAHNETIIVGTTYDGTVYKCLNRICAQLNLKWSIQQGVLVISDKDAPTFSAMAQFVLLSPDTGLVGSPVIEMEDDPKKGKPIGNITAVSLLNHKLLPDRPVKIVPSNPMTFAGVRLAKTKKKSAFAVKATGLYRIERARFVGNNRAGDFHTEITCPVWG